MIVNAEPNELETALEEKRIARLDPMLSGFGMNSRPVGKRESTGEFITKVIENTARNIIASVSEKV